MVCMCATVGGGLHELRGVRTTPERRTGACAMIKMSDTLVCECFGDDVQQRLLLPDFSSSRVPPPRVLGLERKWAAVPLPLTLVSFLMPESL